ncbi:mannosylglycerate hydrolase [Thermaerobacillus caldiproteolyticus]|uniref:Mannosylglycerate hydrolase n=1 Tax=Thermaerobacillus caldiproteolyticus TaxID=247480 RepID=A0A7V9Z8Q3_9BACL|nr:mannosylglycerate hydrolase [Anoxybacillus caldiproteolyticus]MBA2876109.1 mannosylglycerate hydrolase [Anoxybacillus caldiproteolyticus]
MKKYVHIVPHMHWDREWYFSAEESRILLVNNMEEILDMLETNPDYPHYVLDGQTVVLEDYLAVKPEYKKRIQKLVQQGKLIIGPWYTQTDEMVVGGESIVRNLLYGLKDCEEFGEPMKIGYLPDSFGQSSQLPQLLNGFGIQRAIFWRGISERHGTDQTEFYWASDEGSRVLVQVFPLGYAIGKYLPTDEAKLKKRMDTYFSVLDRRATTDHIIIPNGHDQMPIQKNIFDVIEVLRKLYPERIFFLSRYEHIFDELEKQEGLATIKGEFLDGKYMRVHRSIYSTRMDIKAANTRIENKITNILEPLASIASTLGFAYHHKLIELIWKEMMKNHAHDSIGCCCSDKVHRDIMSRFFIAEEKADQLISFYMRKIADAMPCDQSLDKLVVYNFLPYERNEPIQAEITTKIANFKLVDENENEIDFEVVKKETIDPGLVDRQIVHYGNYDPFVRYTIQFQDDIPAMGYRAYFIKEADTMIKNVSEEVNQIDTEFYSLTVNENGTLKIYDKTLQRTFDNVLLIEDMADDGDEYDYSPLLNDFIVLSDDVKAQYSMRQNQYFAYVDIHYQLPVPANIESRKAKRRDSFIDVNIQLTVPMNKPIIDVKMDIENIAKDHRVRAYIPTGISSTYAIADNQFGNIKRRVVDPAIEVWETENWDERPDSIYPMLSYVGLSNEHYGVAVLTNSTREYEIVGEHYDTIAVTLFRSIGYLGKEDIVRRPGRPSGIKMETPDSQMIGSNKVHFAITTHQGTTVQANVAKRAKEFLTPLYTYNKMPYDAMKMNNVDFHVPYQYSLFEQKDPYIVLSAVKRSEDDSGIIVRFYNPSEAEKKAIFQWKGPLTQIQKTNLNEKIIASIAYHPHKEFEVNVKRNQVQTVLVQL